MQILQLKCIFSYFIKVSTLYIKVQVLFKKLSLVVKRNLNYGCAINIFCINFTTFQPDCTTDGLKVYVKFNMRHHKVSVCER